MNNIFIENNPSLEKKAWFRVLKVSQAIALFCVVLILIFQIIEGYKLSEIVGVLFVGPIAIRITGRAIVYMVSGE